LAFLITKNLSIFNSKMKKIIAYLFLILFLIIYGIGSSKTIMGKLKNSVFTRKSGDLYYFSYLKAYKNFRDVATILVQPLPQVSEKKVNLYALHDSYVGDMPDSMLRGVNQYKHKWFSSKSEKLISILDSSKTNVLLVEMVERNLRGFTATSIVDHIEIQQLEQNNKVQPLLEDKQTIKINDTKLKNLFFYPFLNQNLEYILFENAIGSYFKEIKAELTYKLFNRTDKDVRISADKKYLYYAQTVDTVNTTSSFCPLRQGELDKLVHELNTTYHSYKSQGFDEVYFVFPPNPVSILQTEPQSYNQLLPTLENHPHLKAKMIPLYAIFRQSPLELYLHSDSHWNKNGKQLFVNELNKKLIDLLPVH